MDTTTSSYWRLIDWLDCTGGAINHNQRSMQVDQNTVALAASVEELLYTKEQETEFPAVTDWLASVEGRIRDSIAPHTEVDLSTRDWLNRDAALAALTFLRDSCDLLPSEPYLYGTPEGDLVAEFETGNLRVTTVIAGNGTTMFGYRRDHDDFPTQCIIQNGSNRRRHEVKEFTQALGIGINGKVEGLGT
ncbi:hypothetical protein [Albibacillus kandeliae]|uniref:hypothetical protein n=1 Tax=Albibacillus kandeliae TaxID=2174228 RepID=UPI0013008FB3|nr:hypothetical protein [Albibacillus kandeliae]